MKKCNKTMNILTFILLITGFLFAPINLVLAEGGASEKTTADSTESKGEKESGGDGEEEPDCE